MERQTDPVRRCDGSIDVDHYLRRSATMRSRAARRACRAWIYWLGRLVGLSEPQPPAKKRAMSSRQAALASGRI